MSTIWGGDKYAPAGHSDVEQMDITRTFNLPFHNISDSSKVFILDTSGQGEPELRDEENGNLAHLAKIEQVKESLVSPVSLGPPPDGGLTAWLQGRTSLKNYLLDMSLT